MISVGSPVFCPRTNGGEVVATVREILPACPSISDSGDMAFVTWPVDGRKILSKWIEVSKLTPISHPAFCSCASCPKPYKGTGGKCPVLSPFLALSLQPEGCLEDPCGRVTVRNPLKDGYVRGIGLCRSKP